MDHNDNYSDYDDVSVADEDLENDLSRQFFKISSATFQGMRVFDSINPSLAQSYFVITIDNKKRYLHKQTAAWILSNEKCTLSSDRLKRVMSNKWNIGNLSVHLKLLICLEKRFYNTWQSILQVPGGF